MGDVVEDGTRYSVRRRAREAEEDVAHLADAAVGKETLDVVLRQRHQSAVHHRQQRPEGED